MRRDYDTALRLLRDSQAYFAKVGDHASLAESAMQEGGIELKQKRLDRSFAAYQRAENQFAKVRCGDPRLAFALCALADMKRVDKVGSRDARSLYEQALQLSAELGFDAGRATALLGLALVDQDSQQFEPARDRLYQALTLYQRSGDLLEQARVHKRWMALCEVGHDERCQRNHAEQAERLVAQLSPDARKLD